jgi:hypothetical protein
MAAAFILSGWRCILFAQGRARRAAFTSSGPTMTGPRRTVTAHIRGDRTASLDPHLVGLIRLLARLAARDEIAALGAQTKESVA